MEETLAAVAVEEGVEAEVEAATEVAVEATMEVEAAVEALSASASSAILSNSLKLTFATFLAEASLALWSKEAKALEDWLVGIFNSILSKYNLGSYSKRLNISLHQKPAQRRDLVSITFQALKCVL